MIKKLEKSITDDGYETKPSMMMGMKQNHLNLNLSLTIKVLYVTDVQHYNSST